MLKKARTETGSTTMEQAKELSQAVLDSSRQIWLAGLGAFARAQQEGTRMFEALVQQGENLESRTRQAAVDTATAARGAASAKAREMQKMAGGTWDKLEQVFEDRVARTLSKLGVYTHNDVQALAQRVDALSEAVNRLIGTMPESSPAGRARATRAQNAAAAVRQAGGARSARKETAKRASKQGSQQARKQGANKGAKRRASQRGVSTGASGGAAEAPARRPRARKGAKATAS